MLFSHVIVDYIMENESIACSASVPFRSVYGLTEVAVLM